MRVRSNVIAGAFVATVSLFFGRAAEAQGQALPVLQAPPPAPPPAVAPVHTEAAKPPAIDFTPPAVLGTAWAKAVRAVLDGVKHLVDVEKVEPHPPILPEAAASTTPPPAPVWRVPVWQPPNRLREAIAKSPVQVGPVSVGPPTESPVDTRGEHAVLLGARVELPWVVP
jgi:hypothetical protein